MSAVEKPRVRAARRRQKAESYVRLGSGAVMVSHYFIRRTVTDVLTIIGDITPLLRGEMK